MKANYEKKRRGKQDEMKKGKKPLKDTTNVKMSLRRQKTNEPENYLEFRKQG